MTWLSVERKTAVRPRTPGKPRPGRPAARPGGDTTATCPSRRRARPHRLAASKWGAETLPHQRGGRGRGRARWGPRPPLAQGGTAGRRGLEPPLFPHWNHGGTPRTLVKVPSPTPDTAVTEDTQDRKSVV